MIDATEQRMKAFRPCYAGRVRKYLDSQVK
jgi:hypothetical protein